MGRPKMKKENKKGSLSITINKNLLKIIEILEYNKSKYIETLITEDLTKNNIIK